MRTVLHGVDVIPSPLSRSESFPVRMTSLWSYASKLARSCVFETETLMARGRMGYCWNGVVWSRWTCTGGAALIRDSPACPPLDASLVVSFSPTRMMISVKTMPCVEIRCQCGALDALRNRVAYNERL